MFLKVSYRHLPSVALIFTVYAFLIIGGFGGSSTNCVGELTVDRTTFQRNWGTGKQLQ